ncbi:hypothetical protein BUALT_Bualt03G0130800 [Buddleja alternifolia]|uniref:Uncharacterized protein n=1 Tax=Buddleja alternifolia TaxID=168488 RepID=A0AAV6XVM4_9LAMI|nr:hypothetical protein BUALT_Bualt03G0130800 [Buddleja alternifolia]
MLRRSIDDGSLSDWFRSQASQAFSSKESQESYLQDVLPPIPDVMNLFQNGFPSIMPRQEQKMSKDLLSARMRQLAITTDDNTGTSLKISGEQYEMESTYNGSSTRFGSTCSVLKSFNCASSYTDSGIEEQHEKLI